MMRVTSSFKDLNGLYTYITFCIPTFIINTQLCTMYMNTPCEEVHVTNEQVQKSTVWLFYVPSFLNLEAGRIFGRYSVLNVQFIHVSDSWANTFFHDSPSHHRFIKIFKLLCSFHFQFSVLMSVINDLHCNLCIIVNCAQSNKYM